MDVRDSFRLKMILKFNLHTLQNPTLDLWMNKKTIKLLSLVISILNEIIIFLVTFLHICLIYLKFNYFENFFAIKISLAILDFLVPASWMKLIPSNSSTQILFLVFFLKIISILFYWFHYIMFLRTLGKYQ